jgi:hypothetical protein
MNGAQSATPQAHTQSTLKAKSIKGQFSKQAHKPPPTDSLGG